MSMLRKCVFGVNLASLLFYASLGHAAVPVNVDKHPRYDFYRSNKSFLDVSWLFVQPNSDDLKYATFVSGIQPYYQSWHYQSVDPDYHSAFDIGLNYALPSTPYSASVYWTRIHTNDSDSKQAATGTDLTTVEFVAPPFEMSPPVFGIKHVDSTAHFGFDNILLNISRMFEFGGNSQVQAKVFGGIDVLDMRQTITTTFGDYAGSPATPYSYPLPPDPAFSFQLENVSKYVGAGPDVGLSVQYQTPYGIGILGQFMGAMTAGRIKTQDNFTSNSTRLNTLGIGTSHQQITAPDATQVVFGADGKLGLFYEYDWPCLTSLRIEAGYRMATYLNAIATVNPSTLVQPGTVIITPEFATGTMAIVSTDARSRPFSFNGPFVDVRLSMN